MASNPKIDLNLAILESFVAIAEELHLGRAAARLHVSESAISKQLTRLEHAVGFKVFRRTSRRVELTAAGAVFLGRVQRALELIYQGRGEAARTGSGSEGTLRVAYRPVNAIWLLPTVVRAHAASHSRVAMNLIELEEELIGQALRAGRVDVGFAISAVFGPGLIREPLYQEPLAVALPATHRLAGRALISMNELRDEKFVIWRRPHADREGDVVTAAFRRAGFEPNVVLEAGDPHTILSLVGGGLGISVMAYDYRHLQTTGVRLVPLKGAPTTTYAVRTEVESAVVDRFLDTVRAVVKSHSATVDPTTGREKLARAH